MTNIEKFIEDLCPNGVEYKPLWSLTSWDKKFNGVDKEKQKHVLKFKHISAKTLKDLEDSNGNIKLLSTGKYDGYTSREKSNEFLNKGEIVSIPSGGSANIKYYNGEFVDSGNILASSVDDEKYLLKFIYYNLLNLKDYVQSCYRGGSVQHPEMHKILEIKIPIPPIEIQIEIVRILDKFSELTAELTAELAARKQQFEYFCENLLTFEIKSNNVFIDKQREIDVEWLTLRRIVNFFNGKGHESVISEDGKYIVVNSKFISTNGQTKKYSDLQLFPLLKNDILLVMSDLPNGKALAKCFIVDKNDEYTLNQRIGALRIKENNIVYHKYLYYILNRNKQLLAFDNGIDQTNLRKNDILDIQVPIPPIEVQKKIVEILDKFDKIVNDLQEGLPAEIEARQKQQEHYRDKLLTFNEKVN